MKKIKASRPEWPSQFADLMSFVYSPRRWSRARDEEWTDALEARREFAAGLLAHRAAHPALRSVLPGAPRLLGEIYDATPSQFLDDLGEAVKGDPPTRTTPDAVLLREATTGERPIARVMEWKRAAEPRNVPEGRLPDKVLVLLRRRRLVPRNGPWSHLAEGLPSATTDHLRTVLQQLERAEDARWRVCAWCGRTFPVEKTQGGNTQTCPPCRRRQLNDKRVSNPEDCS